MALISKIVCKANTGGGYREPEQQRRSARCEASVMGLDEFIAKVTGEIKNKSL